MAGQKSFYMALGALVVVGAGLIIYKSRSSGPVSIPVNPIVSPADTSGFRGYATGSESAPVKITEYGDFECPACGSFAVMQFPDVERRLIQTGKVRFVFRDFPIDGMHSHPREAAHAAACADDQGAYWPMSHAIFTQQAVWARKSNPVSDFRKMAEQVGIDAGKWSDCMKGGAYAGRIQASLEEGMALGVGSTPTFLIDGHLYEGALSSDRMVALVDSIIAAKSSAGEQ